MRFACRTGHAYSPQSVMQEQSQSLGQALWSMGRRTGASRGTAQRFDARAAAVERHAGVIREAMATVGATAAAADGESAV